jgi:hypothetical protein
MAAKGCAVAEPVGRVGLNAFGETQTDEEFLFDGIGPGGIGAGRFVGLKSFDIFGGCFHVLPASDAIEGMGVRSEAEIGFAMPVFEIVQRFTARAREVGDFVACDAVAGEVADGGFVEVSYAISRATSFSTIVASCLRPVRASSVRMKDWTPRLTRLTPKLRQARMRSGVSVPGAASIVASRH